MNLKKINTNVICEVLYFCCAFSKRNNFQVQPFCHAHEYIYTYSLNFIVALTLTCTFDYTWTSCYHWQWNYFSWGYFSSSLYVCMYILNNQPDGFIPFLKKQNFFWEFFFYYKIHGIDVWMERKRPGGEWMLDLHVFVWLSCA